MLLAAPGWYITAAFDFRAAAVPTCRVRASHGFRWGIHFINSPFFLECGRAEGGPLRPFLETIDFVWVVGGCMVIGCY